MLSSCRKNECQVATPRYHEGHRQAYLVVILTIVRNVIVVGVILDVHDCSSLHFTVRENVGVPVVPLLLPLRYL